MARQKGIIKLTGTVDGINFYYRNGKPVIRKAGGGFSGEAIKTKESMRRVRENGSEFGHCSRTKKAFRLALIPFLSRYKDGTLHGRMMQLFLKLKSLDIQNGRGERKVSEGVAMDAGRLLLQQFEFTPQCKVLECIAAPASLNINEGVFTVTDFDMSRVVFPEGATHMALTLGVLHFDFKSLTHELNMSPPFYIGRDFEAAQFEINVDIPEASGTRIAVLGLRYYQLVNGTYSIFNSAKAFGLEVIEVMS